MLNELVLAQTLLGQREQTLKANEQRIDQLIARYGDLDAVPQKPGFADRLSIFVRGLRPQSRVVPASLDGSPATA